MKFLFGVAFIALLLCAAVGFAAEPPVETIAQVQNLLTKLGYDPGPSDGTMGQKTEDAIRAFQEDHDLIIDGKYSGLLVFHLELEALLAADDKTEEGRAKKESHQELKDMSNDELAALMQDMDEAELNKTIELLGEERIKQLPVDIISQVIFPSGNAVQFMRETMLPTLFYLDSDKALEQFQTDMGEPATGVMTFGQLEELIRRATRLKDTPIYSGSGLDEIKIYSLSEEIVWVEGTWMLEDENIAFPINSSKIQCVREDGVCEEITAEIMIPSLDSSDDNYQLFLDSNIYRIVHWSDDEIISQDVGDCRTSLLTLNRNSNEVYEVTRNNESERCFDTPLTLPSLDKPRIARLVPGFKQTYGFWTKRKKQTGEYVNSRFRERAQKLLEED